MNRNTPLRRTRKRTVYRDTGPAPATKALLWHRAKGRCELCGRDLNTGGPFSRHHRRPRGMGGSREPWINDVTNLLLVCGSATTPGGCHGYIETHREEAIDNGWLVPMGYLPAEVPVLIRPGTSGFKVYLTSDGAYADGSP